MEKYIAVYRVRDAKGKHRMGYVWLKKRGKSKCLETVQSKLENGDALTNIWSTDWRDTNYSYTKELGNEDKPDQDFVPLIRGQVKWRQKGKGWSLRKKETVKEIRTYVPKAYVHKQAPRVLNKE